MADTHQLTQMLKQLGWGSGFRLPIANDENKKLEQLLEEKQNKLLAINAELQDVNLAVDNLTAFVKHSDSKILHSKEMEAVKRSHMEQEHRLASMADTELTKTEQDMRKLDKRLRATRERNKKVEGSTMRRRNILNELVDTIQFDKKAITAYEEKFAKEDAYMKLIEEFADTDNEKLKKCSSDYKHLGEMIVKNRAHLNSTILETEILNSELEALAKRFRKAHGERTRTIQSWKESFGAMEERDKEIMEMGHSYKKTSIRMSAASKMLERQEALLSNIQMHTKSYTLELNQLERKIHHLHADKKQEEAEDEELSSGVADLIAYIRKTEQDVKKVGREIKKLNEFSDQWLDKVTEMRLEKEQLQAKYDVVTVEHLTSAEHTKQLQEFLEKEEKQSEFFLREMEKISNFKSDRERQLLESNEKIKLAEVETKNLNLTISVTKKKLGEVEQLGMKSKSMAYRLELKAISLQTKLHSYENPQLLYTKDEYTRNQMIIQGTKQKIKEVVHTKTLLKAQLTQCDQAINFAQKEVWKEKRQKTRNDEHLMALQTEIKSIGREDEASAEEIKNLGVNHSLLQVQLHRMAHMIKDYETKLFDLEQQRVTLEMVVKGRKKDIEVFNSLLVGKKRAIVEESQKLRTQCHEVRLEAGAKKRKYEMLMMNMWSGSDDVKSGEESARSEAYFIIKIAQERERYRQEGDKWDERVKEAEKVVEGLQNTLALMMGTNEAFKESLKPAAGSSPEGQQVHDLKQKGLDIAYNLKLVRDKRKELTRKVLVKENDLDKVLQVRHGVEHELMEKRYQLHGFIVEINGQKDKIQRATAQANKLVKELSNIPTLDVDLLQNDLRLRVTKEKYEFAVATLEKLLTVHPQLLDETLMFLEFKEMENLAEQLAKKLMSPTTMSPHMSGTSTPQRGTQISSSAALSKLSSVSIAASRSSSFVERAVVFDTLTSTASAQRLIGNVRDIVSRTRSATTSASSRHHPSRYKKAAKSAHAGHTTHDPREPGKDTRGISLGELRKALQDAAEEQHQQKQVKSLLQTVKESPEPPPSSAAEDGGTRRSGLPPSTPEKVKPTSTSQQSTSQVSKLKKADSTGIIELVDNKAKFDEET